MKQGLEKKKLKENFSKEILKFFKKRKFNFTDLDLLIDTNLLTERSGEQFKKSALTYKDLLGKEISLRPDLTVSTALKYIQEKKAKEEKYCYYGAAYRLDKKGDLNVFDQLGCEIIKLFPGSIYGAGFVKAIKGPQPWTSVMPTGGVTTEESNLKGWFGAGVTCVGMGSQLISKDILANQDYDLLKQRVSDTLSLIKSLRK